MARVPVREPILDPRESIDGVVKLDTRHAEDVAYAFTHELLRQRLAACHSHAGHDSGRARVGLCHAEGGTTEGCVSSVPGVSCGSFATLRMTI